MSVRVMSKVWEKAPYSGGTLLVLLALADWADDDGRCYPKIEKVAKKARLTKSGTKFCLKRLILDGTVILEEESEGPGKPRKYRVGVQYLHPSNCEGVESIPQKGLSITIQKGCSKKHRNKEYPSLNRQEPPITLCSRCSGTGAVPLRAHPGKTFYCDCPEGKKLEKSEKHLHFAKSVGA